ncbi:MAG: hypothetical protein ACREXR_03940, partial [Gammaproteobacteria bacterium]
MVNGDFLDFVQADPWDNTAGDLEAQSIDRVPLCHRESDSLEKLSRILTRHNTIFMALGHLLDREDRRLTILPGNHDADFFWPGVRKEFTKALTGGNLERTRRLLFLLERVYRPPAAPYVWIEHGHQYDPLNSFFITGRPGAGNDEEYWSESRPPIMDDERGVPRLIECIGTRFLIRFINRLDENYPFVDNIKPFSRFFGLFGSSMASLKGGTARAAVSIMAMQQYAIRTVATRPGD